MEGRSRGPQDPSGVPKKDAEEVEKHDLSEKGDTELIVNNTPDCSEVSGGGEWRWEAAARRLEAVEAELRAEVAARASCELEAADWGRQVALLQAQLREAASLLEDAPDRLHVCLRQQQLLHQVEELKGCVAQLESEKEDLQHLQKCKENDLINMDHQYRTKQEQMKEELLSLREDKVSLENVVSTLRAQLKLNHTNKKEEREVSKFEEEVGSLREANQKANQELSSLRSKHAILREENSTLYAKIEELEGCDEVLRQVEARSRLLEEECLALQAEKQAADNEAEVLYSRWRSAEQEALRFKRLYLRAQNQQHPHAIPEEAEEETSFRVEDELEAAEKGALGRRVRVEETSGEAAGVETCARLEAAAREARAAANGAATQLAHERERARALQEEKGRLLAQNRALGERLAQAERGAAQAQRGKLLLNQLELKVGGLENERRHLQAALRQLEERLLAPDRPPAPQDLEGAAKQAVLLSHHNKHLKHTENMLRWRVEQLELQVGALEAALEAVGARFEESVEAAASAWAEAASREEAAVAASREAAASSMLELQQRLEAAVTAPNPLRPLVEEMASEVAALKSALRGQRREAAARDAPLILQQRLAASNLINQINQQKDDLQQIKSEGEGCLWAVRLEEQLTSMLDELERQKKAPLREEEASEGKEEEKERLLQSALVAQKEAEAALRGLEAEVRALEGSLEAKERLLQQHQQNCRLHLQQKELELKRCHAEALAKQVELVICRCRPPPALEAEDWCCSDHLEEVGAALEAVHAEAVARLRREMAAPDDPRPQLPPLAQLEAAEAERRQAVATRLVLKLEAAALKGCDKEALEAEVLKALEQLEAPWGRQLEAEDDAHFWPLRLSPKKEPKEDFDENKEFDEKSEKEKEGAVEALLKADKERHNNALLGRLERSVSNHFNKCLQEFWGSWKERAVAEVEAATEVGELEEVVGRVEAAGAALGRCYQAEAAKLQEAVAHANSALRQEAALAQRLEAAEAAARLQQQRHQQELDQLRAYFEKHCDHITQKYQEEVFLERSRRPTTPDPEVTPQCDTFSEAASLRLEAVEEAWRGRLEAAAQAHAAQLQQAEEERETLRHELSRCQTLDETRLDTEAHLHQKVDALAQELRLQAQKQMEALREEGERTLEESVRQRDALVQQLEQKFQAQIEELKRHHQQDLEDLERELSKEHEEALTLALTEMQKKLGSELEGLEAVLAAAHAKELDQLQRTVQQQEAALEAEQEQMAALLEAERSNTVAALGAQLQALLAEQGAGAWPPEVRRLKQVLDAEAEARERDLRQEVNALQKQLHTQLPLRDQFLQQKQVLGRENELLRGCVEELVRYLSEVDAQLNSWVEAGGGGVGSLGGGGSDTESVASSEEAERRRLHLAPDLSALSTALEDDSSALDSDAVRLMRLQLDECLARLRAEVADIVGVSEASLVGNKQVEELERRLAASEARASELALRLATRDDVSEAVGAEAAPLGLEARLRRLARLHDRARAALQDQTPLNTILLQLCEEGQHLADEAVAEKDDLLQQIESADKKVRAHRAFLDEQAAEREQERDEFARQLQQLRDLLRDRDRDKQDAAARAKEVEALEAAAREQTAALHAATQAAAHANVQLKAANDKVGVLREVVSRLEAAEAGRMAPAATTGGGGALSPLHLQQLREVVRTLDYATSVLLQKPPPADDNEEGKGEGVVGRLEAAARQMVKAAEAAMGRLQAEVRLLRQSQEEAEVERGEMQGRLDAAQEAVCLLQAAIDQHRLQQTSVREQASASLRQAHHLNEHQLDAHQTALAAQQLEVKELRAQLEKCKKAVEAAEAETARRDQEATAEVAQLRQQLEAAEAARPQLLEALSDALRHNADCSTDKLKELLQEVHSESLERALSMSGHCGRLSTDTHRDILRSADNRPLTPSFANTTLPKMEAESLQGLEPDTSEVSRLKEEEIERLKKELEEVSKVCDALQEEKRELQRALSEASSLFEACAASMQTELAAGQPAVALDTSMATDALQRALSRVQDGGVEVLCLSEAVSRLPQTANAASQTVRSSTSDALVLADLKTQIQQIQAEAVQREEVLKDRLRESEERCSVLRVSVEASEGRLAAEASAGAQTRLEAERERCRASTLDSALSAERLMLLVARAQLEGEAARHRATRAALDALRGAPSPQQLPSTPPHQQVSAALRNAHLLLAQVQEERERLEARIASLEAALEAESRGRTRAEAEREATARQLVEERGRLSAAGGSWEAARVALEAKVERLRHEAMAAEAALSAERAAALVQRMRLQYHAPSPHHSPADDDYDLRDQVATLSGRCARLESLRRNLVWQKRYLMIVVATFDASHRRLRKALDPSDPPKRTPTLKAAALVAIAVVRVRSLVARRRQRARAPLLVRPPPSSPEPRLQPRAPRLPPLPLPRWAEEERVGRLQQDLLERSELIRQQLGLHHPTS